MVNMEEMVRVRMTGGPPWGFRLLGGIEHGLPVSVSKIRKKSKADYADLQEGDRVLSINGKPVRNAARDVAMAYIEDADDSLDLEIVRTRNANPRTQDRQMNIQMNQDKQTSVTIGQPTTINIENPTNKPGTWQPTQRHASPAKQQPVYQQPSQQRQPPPQRQQQRFQLPQQQPPQQKPKSKFEMPRPSDTPRYNAPGPKADFAIQYNKPQPLQKSRKQPSAYEPVSIMQSKPGGKAAGVGRELTITFAMPDENTKVDFGSPPESPSGMSVDSGVPPESPRTPKKHTDEVDLGEVYRDPSIILRSLAKDQPAPERLQRPFSEPAGRVSEEPEVSIVEKRRACKTIADLLMFPKNKQAKGARMFAKRRKRSARYTIEAIGQKDSDEDSDGSESGDSGAAIVTIKTVAPPPPPPITNGFVPAAPPPPPGGFVQRIKVEPTNFNIKLKSKDKCEHNAVSPKQCMVLADSLKSQGRAAEMFEKRRLRSEQFVLDESNIKNPKPPTTFKKPPGPQTTKTEIQVKKVSPWEAAQESPVGNVSKAFPPKEIKIPPPTVPKPKPPAAWMKTSNMTPEIPAKPPAQPRIKPGFKAARDLPKYPTHQDKASIPLKPGAKLPNANFKDFNTKPRGWGSRGSGDNTPGSPASSVNSDQGSIGRGQIPTRPLKYSGGYNDFNPKPKSFGYDSPRHGALSPTTSLAESDDL